MLAGWLAGWLANRYHRHKWVRWVELRHRCSWYVGITRKVLLSLSFPILLSFGGAIQLVGSEAGTCVAVPPLLPSTDNQINSKPAKTVIRRKITWVTSWVLNNSSNDGTEFSQWGRCLYIYPQKEVVVDGGIVQYSSKERRWHHHEKQTDHTTRTHTRSDGDTSGTI